MAPLARLRVPIAGAALALSASLLPASSLSATAAAPTPGPTASAQALTKAPSKKVSAAQARKAILKVHRLGKAGKYTKMRRHASAEVVKHYRTWNATHPEFPDARTQWRFAGNCMTRTNESYKAYSLGKGRAGCAVSVWLVGSDPEVADYSFLTVKRKKGKLYVNSINHLAG